jgi:O-antigen ligase
MNAIAYAALWVFVFSMPWENLIVISGVGAISRLFGMVAFSVALITAVISARIRRLHALHVLAVLFVLWAAVGLMLYQVDTYIPKKFLTYVQLIMVLWIIWELAPTRQRALGLLAAYVFGAYVAALNTIMVFRTEAGLERRFSAEGFDPNDLAMTLVLALPMAWYLSTTYHRPILRWICRGYLPVGLFAIVLTGSRGGMVAGLVGLMVVPFTMTRLSPAKLAAAALTLAISGALAVAYTPQTIIQRLSSTQGQIESGTMGGRTTIWMAGAKAFIQKPITGYGSGSFAPAIRPILGYPRVSHNSYLTVLVEQGLVGFLLYIGMFFAVFFSALRLPLLERRFTLILLATLAVAMLPLAWEDQKAAWFTLAAVLALAQGWGAGVREAAEEPSPLEPSPYVRARAAAPVRQRFTARVRNTEQDTGA